jgi:hypothetical protein
MTPNPTQVPVRSVTQQEQIRRLVLLESLLQLRNELISFVVFGILIVVDKARVSLLTQDPQGKKPRDPLLKEVVRTPDGNRGTACLNQLLRFFDRTITE